MEDTLLQGGLHYDTTESPCHSPSMNIAEILQEIIQGSNVILVRFVWRLGYFTETKPVTQIGSLARHVLRLLRYAEILYVRVTSTSLDQIKTTS